MTRIFSPTAHATIDVWKIDLSDARFSDKAAAQVLSREESMRAGAFYFPDHRRRFTASHFALRLILSRYSGRAPEKLKFFTNGFGKPFLRASRLKFNLSHSGETALVAVTNDDDIGVDVEYSCDKSELAETAKHFFSAEEIARLDSVPGNEATKEFFRLWTRKESYVKAVGRGLSIELKSFSVVDSDDEFQESFVVESGEAAKTIWRGWDLELGERYAGALATNGKNKGVPAMLDFNSLIKKALD